MNEHLLQNLHTISTRPINFFPLSVDCHRILARVSPKISDEDGRDGASDLLAMGREHCPRDKARPIGGKDDLADRSDSPRGCEKSGLGLHFPAPLSDRYLLPDTSRLCKEFAFAKVKIGWSDEGIAVDAAIHKKVEQVLLPEIQLGDGLELFIDTRDRKTTGANTRFCHHFGFIPQEFSRAGEYHGLTACELTRFRTEDKHEHCPPQDLLVESRTGRSSYQMMIFIPTHCLYGFDPHQFERIGFTYRINRYHHLPQHFHAVCEEFSFDQHPSHWASLRLVP